MQNKKLLEDSYVMGVKGIWAGRQCAWPYFRAAQRDGPRPCPCFLILSHRDSHEGVEEMHNPVSGIRAAFHSLLEQILEKMWTGAR